MKLKKQFLLFLKNFFHVRVFMFIIIGIAVIFLTFFTSNNALEIAISGIASVFIGIGVNNLSLLETQLKDEQKMKMRIKNITKVMEITRSRINTIREGMNMENFANIKSELAELETIMNLSIGLIEDEDSLH